ncbi:MAG: glycosyltransferase family 2 protein [Candidatus Andersenbacteria bacterium]
MTTSAVVVTYNSAATLTACLASLRQNGIAEVVVVDNASTDATTNLVHKLGMHYFPQSHNVGFATACNRGAQSTMSDYILFLNPDAAIFPGALAVAEKYLVDHPKVGVAGLLLVTDSGRVEEASFGSDVTLLSLLWRRLIKPPPVPAQPISCGWVSAGACLVRRHAFDAVGGFDPQFFLYWEDVDFGRRLRQAGWRVVLVPQARAYHQRGASQPSLALKTRLYDESADRYFRKHYAGTICLLQRFWRRLYRLFSPSVH